MLHIALALPLFTLSAPPRTDEFPPADVLAKLELDLRVPIHGDLLGRGTWAAGENTKASFHDGFAFHPVLEHDAEAPLPLH